MAQVTSDDAKTGKDAGQSDKVADNSIQESGISTAELKALAGKTYGSNVEIVEEQNDANPTQPFVAKLFVKSYGTGTFALDGAGKTAEEARTDLWNRFPKYPGSPDPSVLSEPHDYTKPNGI